MKVLHVIPAFYPAFTYGGPIETTYQLCLRLALHGCEVRVLTTDANGPNEILNVEKDREVEINDRFHVRYCKRLAPHTTSPIFLRLLPSYIHWADVVHLTGAYSFPTIPTLLGSKILRKSVIWSPQGALKRWEGSTHIWIKSLWEWVCELVAPPELVLHVTSEEEAAESSERLPGLTTFVIPNGATVPDRVKHHDNGSTLRLLYLGRLHPIKGIENLLRACTSLGFDRELAWSLTIAGAGEPNYTEGLRVRITDLALSENVRMVGEVRGEAKQELFENSDVVIVPSYSENFGMVVAEALAHGIPVIAGKGTPWRKVEEIGCGLWVDNESGSLAMAIKQICQMPLREMGQRGREWMTKEFSWDSVAKQMVVVYKSMINRKERNGENLLPEGVQ